MKEQFSDNRTGINYILQGDYYLPCLSLPERDENPIGLWGQRHLRYIKNRRKIFYYNLLTAGELPNYLADIDEQAEQLYSLLIKQIAENENITEKLKSENLMLWVKKMNSICNRAMEVVNSDIIFA